jgi:hypothetical protein
MRSLPPHLSPLQHQLKSLSLTDKRLVAAWLNDAIANEEALLLPEDITPKPHRQIVQTKREGAIVYQRELVKCGKPTCRCMLEGKLHGPYWYKYQRQQGKLVSSYVGKSLSS